MQGQNGAETEVKKPIDAGKYVVKVTFEGDDTYEGRQDFDGGWTFTINGKPAETLTTSEIKQNYL